jgi:hypothetical protein
MNTYLNQGALDGVPVLVALLGIGVAVIVFFALHGALLAYEVTRSVDATNEERRAGFFILFRAAFLLASGAILQKVAPAKWVKRQAEFDRIAKATFPKKTNK